MGEIFTKQILTNEGLFEFRIEPLVTIEPLFFNSDNIFSVHSKYNENTYCFHFRLDTLFRKLSIIDKNHSPSEIKNLEQILYDSIYSKRE